MTPASVLHVDPERGFSGGETQVLALARELGDAGVGGAVACDPAGQLVARAQAAGIATIDLPVRRGHDPVAGLRLRAIVREARPDVVHFHTARSLTLASFVPRPALRVVTRRMDQPPRGAGAYVRWLYRQVDAIIAISQAAREGLVSRGVPRDRIDLVHSGVDVARFAGPAGRDDRAREALGVPGGRSVVAIVAQLHRRKGHDVLLQALARLPRDTAPLCLAAGTGPEGDALLDLARRLGPSVEVRWLGQVAGVRDVLRAADVVAMPSRAEGLGVAAIEALAAARPVVASAVGGLPEIVRDGLDGLLVPPEDPAALAAALSRCLADAGERDRMGEAGRLRAEGFSTSSMARGTLEVYQRLLAREHGQGGRGAKSRPDRPGA